MPPSAAQTLNLIKQCRKLVCVGRNFAEHARELKNAVPTTPVLFLKPSTALLPQGKPIIIPKGCTSLHHYGSKSMVR
jgi:2-keto-4-pentenoate hydratase/2-oxohepta-3-ene-1,7-dioic acid hydratase in catechol pathway